MLYSDIFKLFSDLIFVRDLSCDLQVIRKYVCDLYVCCNVIWSDHWSSVWLVFKLVITDSVSNLYVFTGWTQLYWGCLALTETPHTLLLKWWLTKWLSHSQVTTSVLHNVLLQQLSHNRPASRNYITTNWVSSEHHKQRINWKVIHSVNRMLRIPRSATCLGLTHTSNKYYLARARLHHQPARSNCAHWLV